MLVKFEIQLKKVPSAVVVDTEVNRKVEERIKLHILWKFAFLMLCFLDIDR